MLANALMCATCRYRPPEASDACGLDGQSVTLYVLGVKACPLGRHLDADGHVSWQDLPWEGPPIFHRWLVKRRWFRRRIGCGSKAVKMPGCGCYVPLKRWWVDSVPRRILNAFRGV